jgi:hypothetical protein
MGIEGARTSGEGDAHGREGGRTGYGKGMYKWG